jgi:hypothetical protein
MNNSLGTVSVLSVRLLEPTLELVTKLEATQHVEPNEVQAPPQENGYSCAIVTLNALLFESAINRVKYLRHEISNENQVKYFAKVTSNADLAEEVDEMITVRDTIVHNHLWEAEVYWDENHQLKFKSPPKLVEGFGNKRLRRVLNPKTRQSRKLNLNLYPLRIWRADAYTSLRVINRVLESLEDIDRNYFYITGQQFMYRGNTQTLKQVIETLPHLIS